MATARSEMHCDVYGLRIRAAGDWPEVVEALRRDFAWFPRGSGKPDVNVEIRRRAPDLGAFGPLEAGAVTWKSTEFRDGAKRIVDYLGHAVGVDDGTGTFTIDGDDGWFVWRASYEYLLRAVGYQLDRIGLARVDGLGLAGPSGGLLVILESGGGKTTLALRAIAAGRGIISEATPLLDARARLHPFPMPLLVRGTSPEAASLPQDHVRRLAGIDPDPFALELDAFAQLVPKEPVQLRHVVFAVRSLAPEPLVTRAPWRSVFMTMARAAVGGYGVFEGGGLARAPGRLWAARRRGSPFVAALRKTQAWRLRLSLDKEANWNALEQLL